MIWVMRIIRSNEGTGPIPPTGFTDLEVGGEAINKDD